VDGRNKSYVNTDIYQLVTDRIVRLLEAGTVPWPKPWRGAEFAPQNIVSRKAYRGINLMLLYSSGFASPFWLTFRQAHALGGKVKKGEKSLPVVFWKFFEDEEDSERRKVPLLRYSNVFNLLQCDGIKTPGDFKAEDPFVPIERCEQVLAEMPQLPQILEGYGYGSAWYCPLRDCVQMPDKASFSPPEAYYSVLFHELTHATGHASRLGRKAVGEVNAFGSDPYSREELVAEMGAAFICGHCGIESATINQSASYIQNWLERLKNDRKLIIHAAGQGQKAADFILNRKAEESERTESEAEEEEALG
jgi:antirestriction protein ArdC